MKITYFRHKDKTIPMMPGSYLLTGVTFMAGQHHTTGVFVHAKMPEEQARHQIKLAFRHARNGTLNLTRELALHATTA